MRTKVLLCSLEDGVKYIFHKGEYSFDPTIGEFGGYALNVTTL